MNTLSKIIGSSAFFLAGAMTVYAHADDATDFVEEASAKSISIIETGKLALEKSNNSDVRKFAQELINDHTKANQKLAEIAARKNLEVADNAELLNRVKSSMLRVRTDASFDSSYTQNQVTTHEQTIEVFEKGTRLSDPELKSYAEKKLPHLQKHLTEARKLAAETERQYRDSPDFRDVVPTTDRDPVAPGTQPAPR